MQSQTLYDRLGVKSDATSDEIKKAYKKLALLYHPDRNRGSKEHEEKFKLIVEAHQTLIDPYKRQAYDMILAYSALNEYSQHAQEVYRQQEVYQRETQPRGYWSLKYARRHKPFPWVNFWYGVLFMFSLITFSVNYDIHDDFSPAGAAFVDKNFDRALELMPNMKSALYERAIYKLGVLEDTAAGLEDLQLFYGLQNYPSEELCYLLGTCYEQQKDFSQAYFFFNEAYVKGPFNPRNVVKMADTYAGFSDYDRAIYFYNKAHRLDNDLLEAYIGQASAERMIGRFDQATKTYSRAIALSDERNLGELYWDRGVSHLANGDTLKAHDDFLTSVSKGHEDAMQFMGILKRYVVE